MSCIKPILEMGNHSFKFFTNQRCFGESILDGWYDGIHLHRVTLTRGKLEKYKVIGYIHMTAIEVFDRQWVENFVHNGHPNFVSAV